MAATGARPGGRITRAYRVTVEGFVDDDGIYWSDNRAPAGAQDALRCTDPDCPDAAVEHGHNARIPPRPFLRIAAKRRMPVFHARTTEEERHA